MNLILIERIKKLLNEKSMTQSDLARISGIRNSSISDYLSGKYEPKQDKIALIAKALNVSAAWLMGVDYINNSESTAQGYYTDPETAAYAEELRTNPELKVLFSASKDLTKEQMKEAYNYIKFLKLEKERNNDD